MLDRVFEYICRNKLFEQGDSVVLGVSGGADSMAMLHILDSLSSRLDVKLQVAHLNHKLRGLEAKEDAFFVRGAAEAMGLPCTIGEVDVPAMISQHKLSTEEAARKARYDFLLQTAQDLGANKIAVAHNADDQAETLVMHLVKGTGLEGLSGMKPASGCIVRPLLFLRRREIEAFCRTLGITFRTDSTNADLAFLRNRIRHQLIPVLMGYNSNIVEALIRTGEIIRAENDYIEEEALRAYESVVAVTDGRACFNPDKYRRLDTALQRRLVRHVFQVLVGKEHSLEFPQVERVREFVISGQTGKVLELPKKVVVEKGYSGVIFSSAEDSSHFVGEAQEWEELPLVITGITVLPAVKAKIAAEVLLFDEAADQFFAAPAEEAYLDMDKLVFPLTVGPKREGEVFQPLGSAGSKTIKKFFIDEKVPRQKRWLVPVLYDGNGVVWVCGLRIDDRVKITCSTRKVLHLKLEQNQE